MVNLIVLFRALLWFSDPLITFPHDVYKAVETSSKLGKTSAQLEDIANFWCRRRYYGELRRRSLLNANPEESLLAELVDCWVDRRAWLHRPDEGHRLSAVEAALLKKHVNGFRGQDLAFHLKHNRPITRSPRQAQPVRQQPKSSTVSTLQPEPSLLSPPNSQEKPADEGIPEVQQHSHPERRLSDAQVQRAAELVVPDQKPSELAQTVQAPLMEKHSIKTARKSSIHDGNLASRPTPSEVDGNNKTTRESSTHDGSFESQSAPSAVGINSKTTPESSNHDSKFGSRKRDSDCGTGSNESGGRVERNDGAIASPTEDPPDNGLIELKLALVELVITANKANEISIGCLRSDLTKEPKESKIGDIWRKFEGRLVQTTQELGVGANLLLESSTGIKSPPKTGSSQEQTTTISPSLEDATTSIHVLQAQRDAARAEAEKTQQALEQAQKEMTILQFERDAAKEMGDSLRATLDNVLEAARKNLGSDTENPRHESFEEKHRLMKLRNEFLTTQLVTVEDDLERVTEELRLKHGAFQTAKKQLHVANKELTALRLAQSGTEGLEAEPASNDERKPSTQPAELVQQIRDHEVPLEYAALEIQSLNEQLEVLLEEKNQLQERFRASGQKNIRLWDALCAVNPGESKTAEEDEESDDEAEEDADHFSMPQAPFAPMGVELPMGIEGPVSMSIDTPVSLSFDSGKFKSRSQRRRRQGEGS